jgi:VWFA-related protein
MRPGKLTLLASALFLALHPATAETAYKTAITRSALSAQAAPQAPTLKVYSREKIVDVTVTDANGNPVHGLTQSDFLLKEDGKPQSLRSFREYGEAVPTAAPTTPPKLPPNVYTNLQPAPPSPAVNILLLDFVNTAPDGDVGPPDSPYLSIAEALDMQNLMRNQAIKYVHDMPPGTRVAVMGITWPGSLRVLQGVTSDPALLTAAVNSFGINIQAMGRSAKHAMAAESLNQLAAVAAQIKGRKNLIWFCYGLSAPGPDSPRLAPEILQAVQNLAEAQVTAYPIGARGAYYMKDPLPKGVELLMNENVAEAGGGISFHDRNDLATGIARAIDNGSHYYTLTYAPPDPQYDGRHHTISVKLTTDRPGLKLTYRDEYYAEDPARILPAPQFTLNATPPTANVGGMRVAMSRSQPANTQLLFDVKVEPSDAPASPADPPVFGVIDPKLKSKPLTRYGVLFALPVRQIAFTAASDGTHRGSVEFDLAAYDPEGKLITSLSQTMTLPLTSDEYQQFTQSPFRYFQQLDLPPGLAFLRIGIRDAVSNKIGTLEIPLTVPKNPIQHAAIQPTLIPR